MTQYSYLINNERLKLKSKAGHLLNLIDDQALLNFEEGLLTRLDFFCGPTIATEDEIARMQNRSKRTLEDIFSEYKELKRIVFQVIDNWFNSTIEFLERLTSDYDDLSKTFGIQGKVQKVTLFAGDSHNGGRGVIILTFSNKKVIYKPKNLEISKAFYKIWKGYRIICKPTYGWEECIEGTACHNRALYFERAGHLLCLLYLLEGADFQLENIIASYDYPYVIDTETLIHNEIPDKYYNFAIANYPSVIKTALLPVFVATDQGGPGVDISGLKAGGFCPENYIDEIVKGFHEMYKNLQKNKESFLQKAWELAQSPTRIVIRPTNFYHYILKRLCLPQALLNHKCRENELNLLSTLLSHEGKSALNTIVEEEKKALLQGDIPYFSSHPMEKHVYAQGKCLAENILEKTGFEKVKEKVENLGDDDLILQESLIRQSFCIYNSSLHVEQNASHAFVKADFSENQIWQEIFNIAKNLRKKSLNIAGDVNWIALEPDLLSKQYNLRPLSNTLYEGRVGIALFFAALGFSTQEEKFKSFSLELLKDIRKKIYHQDLTIIYGIGGFSGLGGISYALYKIGHLLQEPSLIKDAKALLSKVTEEAIRKDDLHDIIAGSAGLILALIGINEPQFFPLAAISGDHLCEKGLEKDFYGFSHGGSGIAHALFQLASITNNKKYHEGALQALRFENELPHSCESRWCRGLTGIGISRLACRKLYQDDVEIKKAIEASIETLHMGAPSLCCGTLGKIEFLLMAAEQFQDRHLKELAYSSIPTVLKAFKEQTQFYKPGLMQGEAGLGLTLLRMVSKQKLPNVLLLN